MAQTNGVGATGNGNVCANFKQRSGKKGAALESSVAGVTVVVSDLVFLISHVLFRVLYYYGKNQ